MEDENLVYKYKHSSRIKDQISIVTLLVDYTLDEQPQVLIQDYTCQHISVSNCSFASFGWSVLAHLFVSYPHPWGTFCEPYFLAMWVLEVFTIPALWGK